MTKAKIAELDTEMADLINRHAKETGHDKEVLHELNDGVLCMLLQHLGFNRTVDAFEATDRWYA